MAGLLDFLQSASNASASTVSGPVDMLSWLLQKAGVPVGNAPPGGSAWMEQKGLTKPVKQSAASLAGETVGLLSPTVAAAKALQIAKGLLQVADNAAAPSLLNKQRGVFMGDLSKTWDKAAADKAMAMEKAGADPRAIWQETGTFKGADGKWRQEIDDSAALFNPSTINGVKRENDILSGMPGFDLGPSVGNVIDHPLLKAAYPDGLTKSTFIGNKNTLLGDGVQGAYDQASGALTINAPAKAADARSTMLHELQHAIQSRQGFARGGNVRDMAASLPDPQAVGDAQVLQAFVRRGIKPENAPAEFLNTLGRDVHPVARDLMYESSDALHAMNPREAYKLLAGEAEARAVQSRMNLTQEQRRLLFPLDSYDVRLDRLIVR